MDMGGEAGVALWHARYWSRISDFLPRTRAHKVANSGCDRLPLTAEILRKRLQTQLPEGLARCPLPARSREENSDWGQEMCTLFS